MFLDRQDYLNTFGLKIMFVVVGNFHFIVDYSNSSKSFALNTRVSTNIRFSRELIFTISDFDERITNIRKNSRINGTLLFVNICE